MSVHIIQNKSFILDEEKISVYLKIKPGTFMHLRLKELITEAQNIGQPKGIWTITYIDEKGSDYIRSGPITFKSHLLRTNLSEANRFFAYVASCGQELDQWSSTYTDYLDVFLIDGILQEACHTAELQIFEQIQKTYNLSKANTMNPGSLPQWPVSEQKNLFQLFEGKEKEIGVELLSSYLMTPVKTVSGIRYESQIDFSSCELCPKLDCPNRSKKYTR